MATLQGVLTDFVLLSKFLECPFRLEYKSLLDQTEDRDSPEVKGVIRPYLARLLSKKMTPNGKFSSDETFFKQSIRKYCPNGNNSAELILRSTRCAVKLSSFISRFSTIIAAPFPLFQAGLRGWIDLVATSSHGTYIILFQFGDPANAPKHYSKLDLASWAFEKIVNERSINKYWVSFPMLFYPDTGHSFCIPRTRHEDTRVLINAWTTRKKWHNRAFCQHCEIGVCNAQKDKI